MQPILHITVHIKYINVTVTVMESFGVKRPLESIRTQRQRQHKRQRLEGPH